MPAITIILILELVASSLLVSLPVSHPKKDPRILSQNVYLAQDEAPPADQTPAPTEDNSTPSQPTPTDQTAPTPEQPAPLETPPQPTENPPSPQPPTETQNSAPAPPSPETPASGPESSSSANPETATSPISSPEESASASSDLPILNTDELINDVSQIDPKSQEEVAAEDSQLAKITDPSLRATALTTFASEKISDIDKFTRDQDFDSTAFASQRLSDQIDQLKTLSSQTPANEQIQQKLSDLCQQANVTLRTNQEIVPEELEQDLEITRGQCLGY